MEPVRRRGAVIAVSAVTGTLALIGVTAGIVLALGSPSGHADEAAAPSPAPTVVSATGSPAGSATRSPSADPSGAAPSAVQGQASHGTHTGDLRFFLLTPPKGAEVYGDVAGSPLSAADLASGAKDEAATKRALDGYGFTSGAYRTYLTAGGAEVTVKLSRFADAASAAAYDNAQAYEGDKLPLNVGYPARAYHLRSGSEESTDSLLAVSYQGDVHLTITVTGGRAPDPRLLQKLLDAQYQRLRTGR